MQHPKCFCLFFERPQHERFSERNTNTHIITFTIAIYVTFGEYFPAVENVKCQPRLTHRPQFVYFEIINSFQLFNLATGAKQSTAWLDDFLYCFEVGIFIVTTSHKIPHRENECIHDDKIKVSKKSEENLSISTETCANISKIVLNSFGVIIMPTSSETTRFDCTQFVQNETRYATKSIWMAFHSLCAIFWTVSTAAAERFLLFYFQLCTKQKVMPDYFNIHMTER